MSAPLLLDCAAESPIEQAKPQVSRSFWLGALMLIGAAWALQAYAIWAIEYLPLVDLPNHMARHYLEAVKLSGGDVGPYYDFELRLLPNLGADLVLPFLILSLGPSVACKLFLTVAVFVYWLGPAWFIAQQGGYRQPALAAALLLLPFSFSGQFYWGFLNYYSGFGLAFLLLVHFSWLSRQERLRPAQLLLHAALVMLLFVWHLAPWTIYGVIMGCLAIAELFKQYRLQGRPLGPALIRFVVLMLPAMPSVVLLAVYSRSNAVGVNPAAGYVWGGWERKLLLPGSLFRGYDIHLDFVVAALWIAGMVVWFGRGWIARWRWSALHLCLAALCALYLIMPFQLGGTLDSDGRLVPSLMVCAVALLGAVSLQRFRTGAVLLGLCLLLRYGSVVHSWKGYDREMQAHAAGFACIEPESRVMSVTLWPTPAKEYPERHFLSWIILSKNVLVPTQFAGRDQTILRVLAPKPQYLSRHDGAAEIPDGPIRQHYDFVWVYNPAGQVLRMPDSFACVFSSSGVSVWRITPGAESSQAAAASSDQSPPR
jgi:hypothetical protein